MSLETQVILVIIIATFGYGAWAAWYAGRRLHQETAALRHVRQQCRSLLEQQERDAPDIVAALTEGVQLQDALVCLRIQVLHDCRTQGIDISHEILASTAAARLHVLMSGVRYVTGILILIGLMGTLVGLTQAVIGLSTHNIVLEKASSGSYGTGESPQETAGQRIEQLYDTVEQLLGAIGKTFAGMHTAFIASLLAVSLTLILSFISYRLQRRQLSFLTELEESTSRELLPLFSSPQVESVLASLVRALQEGTSQFLGVVETASDRAAHVGENLEYLFTIVREFDDGRKRFEASIAQTTANQRALQTNQDRLATTVQQFAAGLNRLETHEATTQRAITQLEKFCTDNAGLGRILQQMATLQQTLQEEVQQFAALSEDLLGRRLTDIFTQHYQRLREWSETHERINQALQQSLGDTQLGQQLTNELLHQLVERYDRTQAQAQEHASQVLHYQQRSADELTRLADLLMHRAAALSNTRRSAQHDTAGPQPERDPTQDGDISFMPELLHGNHSFTETIEQLCAIQHDFYTKSLTQQQQIVISLEGLRKDLIKSETSTKWFRLPFQKGKVHGSDV